MPTLHTGALALEVALYDQVNDAVDMSVGLYCNGVPLLAGVHNPHHRHLPLGHVLTEALVVAENGELDVVALLRPALEDQRPRLWTDIEHSMHLLLYPPAYMRALHPAHMISWEDTWPELAKDLEEGWRQRAKGSGGVPLPDPAHRRPEAEGHHYLLQVCIRPVVLGLHGSGHIMLELHAEAAELHRFFDELQAAHRALPTKG